MSTTALSIGSAINTQHYNSYPVSGVSMIPGTPYFTKDSPREEKKDLHREPTLSEWLRTITK